ncbi:MAG: class I SAM-dependent methyltransferase [Neisseriaceae bacterium]|nr:class I SAM-dependent methyltransferase [Neisseriaceae bacterium]
MHTLPSFTWQQPDHTALWFSANGSPPPQQLHLVDDTLNADQAFTWATQGHAMLWTGDFHNAKQLLSALSKRLNKRKKSSKVPATAAEAFHKHRLNQSQRAQLLNSLLVKLDPQGVLSLRRAPDVKDACAAAFGLHDQDCILPLQTLLGMIGAHQWQQKGVPIAALNQAHVHVPYGVYSPLRGEYLQLLQSAPLPEPCTLALDIGTGSGVIAAVLAKRGVAQIIGTDINPKAIAAAADNLNRLGLSGQVRIVATDLFPAGVKADLIVCNPPWLPAKPTSLIESALYDPKHQMLVAFLTQAPQHLNAGGEVWLIMSDLAEHLGLRAPDYLSAQFAQAGLSLIEQHTIKPQHAKANDADDAMFAARSQEVTSLYRLSLID